MKKRATCEVDAPRRDSDAHLDHAAALVPRGELRPPAAPSGTGEVALVPRADTVTTSTLLATRQASLVAPNILSLSHWQRLLGGELYAPLSRLDWATLLRRTFDVDVTSCRACGGRMTVRAVLTDSASIAKLLAALRRPRAPPVAA